MIFFIFEINPWALNLAPAAFEYRLGGVNSQIAVYTDPYYTTSMVCRDFSGLQLSVADYFIYISIFFICFV